MSAFVQLDELSELRGQVRMMRLMLKCLPDVMVAIYSVSGVCMLLAGMEQINTVNAAEGKHYDEFKVPEERRERFLWLFERAKLGLASHIDYPIAEQFFEAICKPIEENGKVLFVMIQVRDVTADRQATQLLAAKGGRDSLTGLPGRAVLTAHAEGLIRKNSAFTILFCDLDGFKTVNDTQGHKIGDLVLERVAKELQASIRQGDLAIRMGGDEFVVVLVDPIAPMDVAKRISHRLAKVTNPFGAGCSMGMAQYPEHGTNLPDLLAAADRAMYDAKEDGGGAVFEPTTVRRDRR